MGRTNGFLKPVNDRSFILGVRFVVCRAAPLGPYIHSADDEDDGVFGKRRGQRFNATNINADGRADGTRGADVADVEEDRTLLEVGAAEDFDRTTEIEKRDARRKNDDDWNLAPYWRNQ